MAANDRLLLDKLLEQQASERASDLDRDAFFGFFAVEQLLKDYDLSSDEIQGGIVDGGGDGGLDAVYVFVNSQLLQEDTDLNAFRREVSIDLICIQSKNTSGFSEDAMNKMRASAELLFDLTKSLGSLSEVYNQSLIGIVSGFRRAYETLAARLPTLRCHISM